MNTDLFNEMAAKTIIKHSPEIQESNKSYLKKLIEDGFKLNGEDYRFTNIASLLESINFNQSTDSKSAIINDDESNTIIIKNGILVGNLPKILGVTFSTKENADLNDLSGAGLLHRSFQGGILQIEIEKNVILDRPVRIVRESTEAGIEGFTVIIKAKRNSQSTLIEENIGFVSAYVNTQETYIDIEDGGHLEHIQVDYGQKNSLIHSKTSAKIAQDANYKNIVFHLSGRLNRRNTIIEMNSPGANGESYNLFLTNNNEHSDINTKLIHSAADTTSNQIAKGILAGESKGIFTGKIHIHKHAQRVASGQLNKNLLLSRKAQVHSMPQLEIFADDVKCSHGSTTGQLSEEELFYFQARGIPAEKARTLLAFGFALEIVKKIQHEYSRKRLEHIVLNLLHEKFHIGDEI
jgi:Fe-S cluster assembly protein SufD